MAKKKKEPKKELPDLPGQVYVRWEEPQLPFLAASATPEEAIDRIGKKVLLGRYVLQETLTVRGVVRHGLSDE